MDTCSTGTAVTIRRTSPSHRDIAIPDGRARRALLEAVDDVIRRLGCDYWRRREAAAPDSFTAAQPWAPPSAGDLVDIAARVIGRATALQSVAPGMSVHLDPLVAVINAVIDPQRQPGHGYAAFVNAIIAAGDILPVGRDGGCTVIDGVHGLRIVVDLPDAPGILELAYALRRLARRDDRPLGPAESFAVAAAHVALGDGGRPQTAYRHWVSPGFRDHQTYMSVTDPGEGHLDGTVATSRRLDGVIVHVEHLERAGGAGRDEIEPYRIPHPPAVGRVRLAVGEDAPVSSYVGRPVFEGDVESGLLKTAHTVGAACSELFGQGLAECKIAVEGITLTQAIRYLGMLTGAVRREKHRQVLSAAFNLNVPIIDDRGGRRVTVSDRLGIGRLGIEIAAAAGFDKVTWDGAGNAYPSGCVLDQVGHREALTLVHEAHERGLLTYFSAGFRFQHLHEAVYTGADGIGIGGAQILRLMDADTGHHGPFLPENIDRILDERDLAERHVLGRGAALLARLDRMRYELTITPGDDRLRQRLFHALADRDQSGVEDVLSRLTHVAALPVEDVPPLAGWVTRLTGEGTLFSHVTPGADTLQARLVAAVAHGDLDYLAEQLAAARGRLAGHSLGLGITTDPDAVFGRAA